MQASSLTYLPEVQNILFMGNMREGFMGGNDGIIYFFIFVGTRFHTLLIYRGDGGMAGRRPQLAFSLIY